MLEFVDILLQMEAKPVKKKRRHFFNAAVTANSKLDYSFFMIPQQEIKILNLFLATTSSA